MRTKEGVSPDQSIYGPYDQTLFLGCSILDFSVSAGWNQQASELTVNLAEDPGSSNEKTYWTSTDGKTISKDGIKKSIADPGFTYPNIGAPAFFKMADFEFAGIIQSYTTKEGADGNPTFTVKLVDPRMILDQAQLILDKYEGSVQGVYNLFNIYAYLEHYNSYDDDGDASTASCPFIETSDGTRFSSPVGAFGGSRKTPRGIPYLLIRNALHSMLGNYSLASSSIDDNNVNFEDYYRKGLVGRGGSGSGYGELTDSHQGLGKVKYLLDLSELPNVTSYEYRIAGPIISLSDFINQVCSDAGMDYYVDLLPAKDGVSSNFPVLIIKVRTISRQNQTLIGNSVEEQFGTNFPENQAKIKQDEDDPDPIVSQIRRFIKGHTYEQDDDGKILKEGVVSNTYGRELRADVNTSFLIGGEARQYYQENPYENIDGVGPSLNMTPFWGWDADGDLIQAAYDPDIVQSWRVKLDFRKINLALSNAIVHGLIGKDQRVSIDGKQNLVGCDACLGWVGENELRMALGDYESFYKNILRITPPSWASDGTVLQKYFKTTLNLGLIDVERDNPGKPMIDPPVGTDFWSVGRETGGDPMSKIANDGKTLHSWLSSYASDFYGKQFLVGFIKGESPTTIDPTKPRVCRAINTDKVSDYDGKIAPGIVYSDEPSTEGAWPSKVTDAGELVDNSDVLGIYNTTDKTNLDDAFGEAIDFFKDEQGKLQPMVRYSVLSVAKQGYENKGVIDLKSIGVDDYIAGQRYNAADAGDTSTYVWVKADIHPEWIEGTPIFGADIWKEVKSILLTIPSPVLQQTNLLSSNMVMDAYSGTGPMSGNPRISYASDGEGNRGAKAPSAMEILAGQGKTVNAMAPPAAFPTSAGVPMKSNTLTYGPWKNIGANPGGVQCEIDEGLTPWEYGGISYMNLAGTAKVLNNVTSMQWGERGQITIPGYPTRLLGSCLTLNSDQTNTVENERYGTRKFSLKTNSQPFASKTYQHKTIDFDSLDTQQASATISNINVSVGSNGITTSYQIATFTPVFGRFSKGNADRIKEIGLNRLKAEREMRARNQLKRMLRMSGGGGRSLGHNAASTIGQGSIAPKSATILLVGKHIGWELPYPTGTGFGNPGIRYFLPRKSVMAASSTTLEHYRDYLGTSMMTMDGMFRPTSNRGPRSQPLFGPGGTSWNTNISGDTAGSYSGWNYEKKRAVARGKYWCRGGTNANTVITGGGDVYRELIDGGLSGPLPVRAWGQSPLENPNTDEIARGQAGGYFGQHGVINLANDPDDFKGIGLKQSTHTIAPFPPISGYTGLPITSIYLDFLSDPISNPFLCHDIRATGIMGGWWAPNGQKSDRFYHSDTIPWGMGSASGAGGHDIEGVARSGYDQLLHATKGSLLFRDFDPIAEGKDMFPVNSWLSSSTEPQYADNYRYMSLRGPIMLQSWGYDIQGHPIPNEFDYRNPLNCCFKPCCDPPDCLLPNNARKSLPYLCFGPEEGEFHTDYSRVSDKFLDNWLERSDHWPVAPVDLRFDRKRGVWTTPPSFRMLQVNITGCIDPGETENAEVEKWVHDMDSPDYTIGTGTGDGILGAHELTGQKFCGPAYPNPKGNGGKHIIRIENWGDTILHGKALAYYDTAEGKYWATHTTNPGIMISYPGCTTAQGGEGGGDAGCGTQTAVAQSTEVGSLVCETTGEFRIGRIPLKFGCGLWAGPPSSEWHEDQPPGTMMIMGLHVSAPGQAMAPAERLQFSDDFILGNLDSDGGLTEEGQQGNCEFSVKLANPGGGGCEGINASVDYVASVDCVGASFRVTKGSMSFHSGCLTAAT